MNFASYLPYKNSKLPYLTETIDGVGGRIKEEPADFRVEEIPLYEISGEGPHLYFRVRKEGISTPEARNKIAAHLDRRPREIGVAGYKDTCAVTGQRMSAEHVEPPDLEGLDAENINLEPLGRHRNKLRTGHLEANRFTIKIRDVESGAEVQAQKISKELESAGVPNYYGNQRFGNRGDSAALGECLLKDRLEDFVRLYLGHPLPDDPQNIHTARSYFDEADYETPFDHWPYSCQNRRDCLAAYKHTKNPKVVVGEVPGHLQRLFVSAFQSQVFNEFLSRRLPEHHRVKKGDVARKHDTGGRFLVKQPEGEQPRARNFAISPTGGLPGDELFVAEAEPGRLESEVFRRFGIEPPGIGEAGALNVSGSRRFLRYRPRELEIHFNRDDRGRHLVVKFSAPSGSYATALLREIMKNTPSTSKPQNRDNSEN